MVVGDMRRRGRVPIQGLCLVVCCCKLCEPGVVVWCVVIWLVCHVACLALFDFGGDLFGHHLPVGVGFVEVKFLLNVCLVVLSEVFDGARVGVFGVCSYMPIDAWV